MVKLWHFIVHFRCMNLTQKPDEVLARAMSLTVDPLHIVDLHACASLLQIPFFRSPYFWRCEETVMNGTFPQPANQSMPLARGLSYQP